MSPAQALRRAATGADPLARMRRPAAPEFPLRTASAVTPEAIAFASSTGGPPALLAALDGLRGRPHPPVLIAQHMPANFTHLFAERIARTTGLACREALDGETLAAGRVYLAPGGRHLEVQRHPRGLVARLSDAPPVNFCRPSADPLFHSLAAVFGPRLLAVVLTGMGVDGRAGAAAVVEAGGTVIAQDQASSVVWGMPRAVAEAGLCAAVLPLPEIAKHVAGLVERPALRGGQP